MDTDTDALAKLFVGHMLRERSRHGGYKTKYVCECGETWIVGPKSKLGPHQCAARHLAGVAIAAGWTRPVVPLPNMGTIPETDTIHDPD